MRTRADRALSSAGAVTSPESPARRPDGNRGWIQVLRLRLLLQLILGASDVGAPGVGRSTAGIELGQPRIQIFPQGHLFSSPPTAPGMALPTAFSRWSNHVADRHLPWAPAPEIYVPECRIQRTDRPWSLGVATDSEKAYGSSDVQR